MNIFSFICLFILGVMGWFLAYTYDKKILNLEKKKRELKYELYKQHNDFIMLRAILQDYEIYHDKMTDQIKVSKDIVDAVKVAMKASHPDNNGKAEDFIKYKSLYEQLKEDA